MYKQTFSLIVYVFWCPELRAVWHVSYSKTNNLHTSLIQRQPTSDFRHEVAENCAHLDYYAANSGNFFPTFRNNYLSRPRCSRILEPPWIGPTGCLETSGRNYHYSLRNNPEEGSCRETVSMLLVGTGCSIENFLENWFCLQICRLWWLFYILLTVHHVMILVKWLTWPTI